MKGNIPEGNPVEPLPRKLLNAVQLQNKLLLKEANNIK